MSEHRSDNLTYFEQRRLEELAKASRSSCLVKQTHLDFAELYQSRLPPLVKNR
jgi:hypothetical protein